MTQTITDWKAVLGKQVRPANRVVPYVNATVAFRAMYEAIQTANQSWHYIYLLGWWLDLDLPLFPGRTDSTMENLLRQAADKKVEIRVVLWQQIDSLHNEEVVDRIGGIQPRSALLAANNASTAYSHHQKVLLVKGDLGLIGFCGGMDINHDRVEEMSGSKGSPLHDVHCQILGPAANDLVDVFVQRWYDAEMQSGRIQLTKLVGSTDRFPSQDEGEREGPQSVRIARTFSTRTNGKACAKEQSVRATMIAAIRAARRFIYIEDQYLVCQTAARALMAALPNIQHLTILIPDSSISDHPHVWSLRLQFLRTLMMEGARNFGVFCPVTSGPVPTFGRGTYVHSKTWIIDDELAVIGSANCNNRGWYTDSEVIAAVFDGPSSETSPSFAQRLRMQLWAKHLGVRQDEVRNGLSAKLWNARAERAAGVVKYNPIGGHDNPLLQRGDWMLVDEVSEPSKLLRPCE